MVLNCMGCSSPAHRSCTWSGVRRWFKHRKRLVSQYTDSVHEKALMVTMDPFGCSPVQSEGNLGFVDDHETELHILSAHHPPPSLQRRIGTTDNSDILLFWARVNCSERASNQCVLPRLHFNLAPSIQSTTKPRDDWSSDILRSSGRRHWDRASHSINAPSVVSSLMSDHRYSLVQKQGTRYPFLVLSGILLYSFIGLT